MSQEQENPHAISLKFIEDLPPIDRISPNTNPFQKHPLETLQSYDSNYFYKVYHCVILVCLNHGTDKEKFERRYWDDSENICRVSTAEHDEIALLRNKITAFIKQNKASLTIPTIDMAALEAKTSSKSSYILETSSSTIIDKIKLSSNLFEIYLKTDIDNTAAEKFADELSLLDKTPLHSSGDPAVHYTFDMYNAKEILRYLFNMQAISREENAKLTLGIQALTSSLTQPNFLYGRAEFQSPLPQKNPSEKKKEKIRESDPSLEFTEAGPYGSFGGQLINLPTKGSSMESIVPSKTLPPLAQADDEESLSALSFGRRD